MLGLSNGEIGLLVFLGIVAFGPKDIPVIARAAGRLTGRAMGFVHAARTKFSSFADQTQLSELQQEVQQAMAQLQAIRHQLNSGVSLLHMPSAPHAPHAPHATHAAHAPHASHAPHTPHATHASHAPHTPHAPHASHAPLAAHASHTPHAPHASHTPAASHMPFTPNTYPSSIPHSTISDATSDAAHAAPHAPIGFPPMDPPRHLFPAVAAAVAESAAAAAGAAGAAGEAGAGAVATVGGVAGAPGAGSPGGNDLPPWVLPVSAAAAGLLPPKKVLLSTMKKRTGFQVATLKSPPPQEKQAEEKKTPTKVPSGSSSSSSSGSSSSSSDTTAAVTKECKGDEVTSVPRPPSVDGATIQAPEPSKCSTRDAAKVGVEDKGKAKSPAASSSSSGSTTENGKEIKADTDIEVQSEKNELAKAQPEDTAQGTNPTNPTLEELNDKVDSKNNDSRSLLEVNDALKTVDAMTSNLNGAENVKSPRGSQSQSKKGATLVPTEKAHSDEEPKIPEIPMSDGPKQPDQNSKVERNDAVKSASKAAGPSKEVAAAVVKGSDADAQKDDGSAEPVKRAEVGVKDKNAPEEDTDHVEEAKSSSAKKLSKKGSSSGKSYKHQGDSKPPRAPTPYIIFSNDIRESIKQRNPDMKPTDIMKAIGEQWRNLPKEEKKTYEDKAEAEKAKLGLEQGNTDGPASAHKGTKTNAKATIKSKSRNDNDKPRLGRHGQSNSKPAQGILQDGFIVFCLENRSRVEEGLGEGATLADIQQELSKEWEQLGFEERRKYMSAANASADIEVSPSSMAANPDPALASSISDAIVAGFKETEEGDVEFVLAQTLEGDFVTKRKRLDYTDLDYEEAKKHKSGTDVSNAISAFKRRKRQFYAEIEQRTVNGVLDLDDISAGSMLETLAFLGNMREDVFPSTNTKLQSPDVWMKVPTLGLCLLVQNLLDGERQHTAALAQQLDEAKKRIKELERGTMRMEE
ncbi:unnamed protein product [Closterium sp. NIES-53]